MCPPFLSWVPAHLLHAAAPPVRRQRHRRRGKRGGRPHKLKARLLSQRSLFADSSWFDCLYVPWHSLESIDTCLGPVAGFDGHSNFHRQCHLHLRKLWPRARASWTIDTPAPILTRVNAISRANKTLILNDFLTIHGLDLCD